MKQDEVASLYLKRIDALIKKLAEVKPGESGSRMAIDGAFVGTLGVLEALYGASSSQVKALFEAKKAYTKSSRSQVWEIQSLGESILGTLANTRDEIKAGLIRSIASEAAGEVIGDLVALAKTELKAGYSNVAAVLACAALEDALKRKAEQLGINAQNKTMESVIGALKGKSFFHGAQAPIVSSFVRLRNAAFHADWEKIQDTDVSSLIGFLEPFLLEHFS